MDSEFEIKTEIEIEDWKPPDVSGTSNQNPPLHSHLNELENINDFLPTSKGPISDGFGFEKSVSVRFRLTNVGAGFGSDIAQQFRFGFG